MSSAMAVLVCVLDVLGRSASSLPPIELVDVAPPDVSSRAEAFIRRGDRTIYLITSSPVFREAARGGRPCEDQGLPALKKLASIVVHEEWHILHGSDEKGAYHAQLITLLRLGVAIDSPVFGSVKRSMMDVLRAQERTKRAALVARLE